MKGQAPLQDLCLHQLIERQVERAPEAIAVVFETQHLTYHELNGQANQLAYRLQEVGIRTGGLVGVCMERSLELVVALLAVLKAGGAYVPLDPELPQERLAFMLEDAQVPVVLTQAHLHDPMGLVGSGSAQGSIPTAPDQRLPFAVKTIFVACGGPEEPRTGSAVACGLAPQVRTIPTVPQEVSSSEGSPTDNLTFGCNLKTWPTSSIPQAQLVTLRGR